MSPSQLVIAVFLFTIGFLVGRWALQRTPAQVVDHGVQAGPMPAGFARGSMPTGFARGQAA
jgi:hypothetical protein